jgi:hypothetical protein
VTAMRSAAWQAPASSPQPPPWNTRYEAPFSKTSSHHCQTLPCMSYSPTLFGAYDPTLVVRPANFGSHALGLAERRLHPPRGGADARIAEVDGIGRKGADASTQRRQCGVMRQEKVEEVLQVMASWHDEPQLLE